MTTVPQDLPVPPLASPGAPTVPADVPTPVPTDAALVARVAAGDADALGVLYDRHGAAAYGLARAVVRERADAEDVVAEAFAQLWRTAAQYDPARGSVGAWVTTVVRTRALDAVRAGRRRARATERAATDGDVFPTGPAAADGESPDRVTERRDSAAAVRAGVAALPPAQRQAIELAFFRGLSHAEIAAALAEPLGTVKTRVRAGLRRLRDALRDTLGDTRDDGEGA